MILIVAGGREKRRRRRGKSREKNENKISGDGGPKAVNRKFGTGVNPVVTVRTPFVIIRGRTMKEVAILKNIVRGRQGSDTFFIS